MKNFLVVLIFAHSWYPMECCQNRDCHPVPCAEITKGLRSDCRIWHRYTFTANMIRESLDSNCHVCVNGISSFCMFIPKVTS